MIIDKLSYNSKLRYENAEVKFAFAVITLLICVISRSAVIALIVLVISSLYKVTECQPHCKDTIIPYRPSRLRL